MKMTTTVWQMQFLLLCVAFFLLDALINWNGFPSLGFFIKGEGL